MQDLRSSFGLNFVGFGPLIVDCPIGPTENVRDVTYWHIYLYLDAQWINSTQMSD